MTGGGESIRSIALVRLSAIGDVVHTLPLLHSLRARFPDARITWIVQRAPLELIRPVNAVDEFVLFRRRPLLQGLLQLRRELGDRRFDLVVTPHPSLKAGLVTAQIDAPRKIGFDRGRSPEFGWLATPERIEPRPIGHVADEMLEFADHLGAPRLRQWEIEPTDEEAERWGDLLPQGPPIVAFAPVSSDAAKDWPAERYARLAGELAGGGEVQLVLIGGAGERESRIAREIAGTAPVPVLDLRANDLRRLVWIAAHSAVVVGSDSAPVHVAAALGTPTVALFGATNPARYAPRGGRALVIDHFHDPGEVADPRRGPRKGRMERIPVAEVREAVHGVLARR